MGFPTKMGKDDYDIVRDAVKDILRDGVPKVDTEQLSNVTGSNPFVSSEDDLSDVSVYHQQKSPAAATDYTLLDVSDGPKTLLNLYFLGYRPNTTAGDALRIGPVTVDGTSNSDWPSAILYWGKTQGGDGQGFATGYPIRYDSSLKVEWQHEGDGDEVLVVAYILGSGPHSVAVVQDGEPVYMHASNLSEGTIEGMGIPSGYKIIRNPDMTHPNPQTGGMWDDSKEEVVDHPYWKPFYDALEKARIVSRQYGFREFLKNVGSPANRGKIPLETPDPSIGTHPPDESSDTPVEDAVRFMKEQKDKELPDKIG